MIGQDLTWRNLDSNPKRQFKENSTALKDLNKDFNNSKKTITHIKIQHVIRALCNKNTHGIDKATLVEFFTNIQELLSSPEGSSFSSYFSWDKFKGKSKNEILIRSCYKALKNDKLDLATRILDLISELTFADINKGINPKEPRNLALFALNKGETFSPFVEKFIKKLSEEDLKEFLNQTDSNGNSLLILAIKCKSKFLINTLLNYGADINKEDSEGQTPLSVALKSGLDTEVIQNLILRMDSFDFIEDESGNNYLHLAILHCKDLSILPLLAGKVNVNAKNSVGDTPLHLILNCPNVTKQDVLDLMRLRANPFICNNKGLSPFYYAIEKEAKNIWSIMLNKDIHLPNIGVEKAFIQAVQTGYKEAASAITKCRFDPSLNCRLKAIPSAIQFGFEDIAVFLIDEGSASIFSNEDARYQIFYKALEKKLNKFALTFLEKLSQDFYDKYIILACQYGVANLISHLLGSIKQLNKDDAVQALACITSSKDQDLYQFITPLLYKLSEFDYKVSDSLKDLFTEVLKNFNATPGKETLVLEIIKRLAELKEIPTNEQLRIAIESNYTPAIKPLIDNGVEIIPGLHLAIKNKNKEATSLLLSLLTKKQKISAETFSSITETPLFDLPTLLWFFNTFLIDGTLKDFIEIQYTESVFRDLLPAIFEKHLSVDKDFFENAQKGFDSSESVNQFIENIFSEIQKGNAEKEIKLDKLINFLAKCKPTDQKLNNKLIEFFNQSAEKGRLKLSQARLLGAVYPKESSLELEFPVDPLDKSDNTKKITVNRFIVFAEMPGIRNLFRFNKRATEPNSEASTGHETFQIKEFPLNYFTIIYGYLAEGIWDCQGLDKDKELFKNFCDCLEVYEIELPKDLSKKLENTENKILAFAENPYTSKTDELSFDYSVFKLAQPPRTIEPKGASEDILNLYLKLHPNITKIKIHSSMLQEDPTLTASTWARIVGHLGNLREIHIDLSNDAIIIPKELQNYLFFLTGTKNLDSATVEGIISQKIKIGSLDLSVEKLIKYILDQRLSDLESLDLSNSVLTLDTLIKVLEALPQLTTLNLESCKGFTDNFATLVFEKLKEINLANTSITPESLISFVKAHPQLERINLSSISDKNLEEIYKISSNITLTINNKIALPLKDIPDNIDDAVDLALQNTYLTNQGAILILKKIFNQLDRTQTISSDESEAMLKLLQLIKDKNLNTPHPLISFRSNIKFYQCLAKFLNKHTLDEYLNQNEIDSIYNHFKKLAEEGNLNLDQARELSKLFSPSKVPLITFSIRKSPNEPKKSRQSYDFHPLILLSASQELRQLAAQPKQKSYSLNRFVLKYLHSYLEEGQIDLKKISLDGLLAICEAVKTYGLSLQSFLDSAQEKIINVKFKQDSKIEEFFIHQEILDSITMIDLEKIDCHENFIIELLPKLRQLKGIRLSARAPIPEKLWQELSNKTLEITIVFRDPQEMEKFKFPDAVGKFRINPELDKKVKFASLFEYLVFIDRIPCLNHIDLSQFSLDSQHSEEIDYLVKICEKASLQILTLGKYAKLSDSDLGRIAKSCSIKGEGLKVLNYAVSNPILLPKIFMPFFPMIKIQKSTRPISTESKEEVKSENNPGIPTVNLTEFENLKVENVIDACLSENPLVLNLGKYKYTQNEMARIAQACPNLLKLICVKHDFNPLDIFKQYNPLVEY